MTTETRDSEQKYEVRPGVPLPSFDGLPQVAAVSGSEVETLTTEYYDTEDLRLLRARITLRRREDGTDDGWHLTLPGKPWRAGAASRRELRLPLQRPGDPVPDELARLVRVHTREAGLRPVALIETRRRRTTLRDTSGGSLAEILADEVAAQTFGESTTLSRWNEIELELTGGTPELLRAAGKRLRGRGVAARRPRGQAGARPGGQAVAAPRRAPVHAPLAVGRSGAGLP